MGDGDGDLAGTEAGHADVVVVVKQRHALAALQTQATHQPDTKLGLAVVRDLVRAGVGVVGVGDLGLV